MMKHFSVIFQCCIFSIQCSRFGAQTYPCVANANLRIEKTANHGVANRTPAMNNQRDHIKRLKVRRRPLLPRRCSRRAGVDDAWRRGSPRLLRRRSCDMLIENNY